MKTNTKPTSNEAEYGNKSKPLLSSRLFKFRFWIESSKFMTEPVTIDKIFEYQDQVLNNVMVLFTGFYDKNGKEMYNGDILKSEGFMIELSTGDTKSKYKDFYEVVDNGVFYTTRNIKNNYTSQIPSTQEIYSEFYEVIGNIFENPELL
ncbi:YopX family protein [Flavobacterium psychrophilum]|uniref:YopX family protein n=1 Tax=Flavobacterium psychrophilum TaxID=96345 RepID=UPI000B7C0ED7|nr:YopX family protein [Flavobacterium psychrophilum]SNA84005.1 conserved hypothetical protein [Flavobacterium psychrophilum]